MMRKLFSALALTAFLALLPAASLAVEPDEMLKDQKLELRAREISEELRCLVCQNQSIDDSDAPLAKDLRLLVRERLKAGDSDKQAMDYIVARYGEFVLLKPVFEPHTLLLWGTPFVVLLLGVWGILVAARRRKAQTVAPLSADEKAELDALMKE